MRMGWCTGDSSRKEKWTVWVKFNGPTEITIKGASKIILLMDMENIILRRIRVISRAPI